MTLGWGTAGTWNSMLDKHINPGQQWTELISQTADIRISNSTIKQQRWPPRKPVSKRTSWMSMWIRSWRQSNPVHTLPSLYGDTVHIYTKKPLGQSHVTVWSGATWQVGEIAFSRGLTLYRTRSGQRPFLRHELLTSTSCVYRVSIITNSLALISSAVVVVVIKKLKMLLWQSWGNSPTTPPGY